MYIYDSRYSSINDPQLEVIHLRQPVRGLEFMCLNYFRECSNTVVFNAHDFYSRSKYM